MQPSPVPDAFGDNIFKLIVFGVGGTMLLSLYRERLESMGYISEPMKLLHESNPDPVDVKNALDAIAIQLDAENGGAPGATVLTVKKRLPKLLSYLKVDPNNADTVVHSSQVLKLIQKTCAADIGVKQELAKINAYKQILSVLSAAHKNGETSLMEESAAVLNKVTQLTQDDIILPMEIPPAAVGALELIRHPATVKMLRLLDKENRSMFLVHVTGIFANMTQLLEGARTVAKGCDDRPGVEYFIDLCELRGNSLLIENTVHALQGLLLNEPACRQQCCDKKSVDALVALMDIHQNTKTQLGVINIVLVLIFEQKTQEAFCPLFVASHGILALIELWTRASDKNVRATAQEAITLMQHLAVIAKDVIADVEQCRPQIAQRMQADEQERKQAMLRQRQQQQMQMQMMMQQMGGGMGGMDDMLMG